MVSGDLSAFIRIVSLTCALLSSAGTATQPIPVPVDTSPRISHMTVQPENCPDLPPLQNERLVLYSTHEGAALSSTAVGDRDKEFNVADVVVEKGKDRLYIILSSSDAVIWRFTGDVGRISKMYVSTQQKLQPNIPAAGVVGVEKDRITFGYCLRAFSEADSIAGARTRSDVRHLIGREPDHIAGRYKTSVVSLPSMTELPTAADQKNVPQGFDPILWREVLRFWPSGLAHLDPKSVVSPREAIAYDVLPSQGGLAQLTGAGAILRLKNSNEFKIVRPIGRFPAGMGGAHSAKFLLGRGVPLPAGDPVHSCVVSEESGDVLSKHPHLCGP